MSCCSIFRIESHGSILSSFLHCGVVIQMAARPPPTRPHINLNPSSHFSYSITEWGEDDAWDSASDSESASNSQSVWGRSLNQPGHPRPSGTTSTSTSAPKPVPAPRKSQNSSSSTLALSYTHVSAPSPPPSSSYASHADSVSVPPTSATATPTTITKNGWTIVQKANGDGDGLGLGLGLDDKAAEAALATMFEGGDTDNDMTFEDLGAEFVDMPVIPRARMGAACVRQDAAEIANGTCGAFCLARFILFTYTRRRPFAPFEPSGCWAAWPYPVVAVAVVVTTLEIVVPELRRAVGKAEARAVRQGQSSSQVHRVSVARGRGHGFVFLLSSFTNPSPRTII